MHTALYHGKSLIDGVRKIRVENDDIHAKLMRNYREVPEWWYFLLFWVWRLLLLRWVLWLSVWDKWLIYVRSVDLAYGGTGLGLVFLPIAYKLPSGLIFAMTGQGVRYPTIPVQIIPQTFWQYDI